MSAQGFEAPASPAAVPSYPTTGVFRAIHDPGDRVRQALAVWFWGAVLISAAFVLAVGIRFAEPHFLSGLMSRIQLTSENNIAAWWSGILLLMLAVHAYDVGVAERARSPSVAGAWTILAAILVFFSADEIGSLHERMGMLGRPFGLGSWPMMLLAGAVVGISLLSALWRLWSDPQVSRRLVLPLLLGFGLLGSVAGQEYVGDVFVFESNLARGIRAMLEEGTELFGMLILLATILPLTFGREADGSTSILRISGDGACKLLLVATLCIPLFAMKPEVVGADHKGQIANWLAASALMMAALLALRSLAQDAGARPGILWAIAILAILGSACAVSVDPGMTIGRTGGSLKLSVLGLVVLGVSGLWLAARSGATRPMSLVASAAAVWALLAPALASGLPQVFLLAQALAVATAAGTFLCLSPLPTGEAVSVKRAGAG
ncbi:MAG TPA: hypothetical protein PKA33_11865 [Amaricoccus sp.]|uniref:hypothetical protein n=1 Tax=Amaricoccus sp. TaxID=1872485 RepID=UPI002C99B2E7|nr:hypothetical protein [Amaricoccus sp.]HMQ93715.1 hypothetical protein [Amaricoccus sp.]HMR53152.1 hypothetical protein [Amaricoccus sp.]HMR60669.1 hypothetical protein [Amaricoccus sp.]HMU00048.1 hypothetical protein [Amaricoccus sp.]